MAHLPHEGPGRSRGGAEAGGEDSRGGRKILGGIICSPCLDRLRLPVSIIPEPMPLFFLSPITGHPPPSSQRPQGVRKPPLCANPVDVGIHLQAQGLGDLLQGQGIVFAIGEDD